MDNPREIVSPLLQRALTEIRAVEAQEIECDKARPAEPAFVRRENVPIWHGESRRLLGLVAWLVLLACANFSTDNLTSADCRPIGPAPLDASAGEVAPLKTLTIPARDRALRSRSRHFGQFRPITTMCDIWRSVVTISTRYFTGLRRRNLIFRLLDLYIR